MRLPLGSNRAEYIPLPFGRWTTRSAELADSGQTRMRDALSLGIASVSEAGENLAAV